MVALSTTQSSSRTSALHPACPRAYPAASVYATPPPALCTAHLQSIQALVATASMALLPFDRGVHRGGCRGSILGLRSEMESKHIQASAAFETEGQ
eukprot:COSAG06_NODE_3242_length_5628_cov_1.674806_7_plen_96_part_00